MEDNRKKVGFELLLNNFKSSLGRMILVNIIFAVPLLISLVLVYYLCSLNTQINLLPILMPLVFVLVSPFYAGVVVLCREYSQGIKPDNTLKTYFKAVKENWKGFLLGGVLLYVAVVVCFFSIFIYLSMAEAFWFFYVLLFFSVLIAVFFLFMFYGVFLMTASFDLKLKDVYKNSALMTFGEIKNNFFATICVAALLSIVFFPIIVLFNLAGTIPVDLVEILIYVYFLVVLGLLIPAPCSMIISYFLYPNMRAIIAGDTIVGENENAPAPDIKDVGQELKNDSSDSQVDIESLLSGDEEEYIFYKGKMIKRKTLAQILKESEE